jgi:hypothetical protein
MLGGTPKRDVNLVAIFQPLRNERGINGREFRVVQLHFATHDHVTALTPERGLAARLEFLDQLLALFIIGGPPFTEMIREVSPLFAIRLREKLTANQSASAAMCAARSFTETLVLVIRVPAAQPHHLVREQLHGLAARHGVSPAGDLAVFDRGPHPIRPRHADGIERLRRDRWERNADGLVQHPETFLHVQPTDAGLNKIVIRQIADRFFEPRADLRQVQQFTFRSIDNAA